MLCVTTIQSANKLIDQGIDGAKRTTYMPMILNNCDYYEFTSEGERQAKRSCKEKFDYKNMDELSKFLKNPNISGPLIHVLYISIILYVY